MSNSTKPGIPKTDVVLMGEGIMSATLGTILKELNPTFEIHIFERMDRAGLESSDAWHNAGTGHAAFCELNYTPQKPDGSIDISKAVKISEAFEVSREIWSYLVEKNYITNPTDFITRVPHISLVWGQDNVDFLRKRYGLMNNSPLLASMIYSESHDEISEWAPIVMRGRTKKQPVAATRMQIGTDVFTSHRRVWAMISKRDDGKFEVVFGGDANRNHLAFQDSIESLVTRFRKNTNS